MSLPRGSGKNAGRVVGALLSLALTAGLSPVAAFAAEPVEAGEQVVDAEGGRAAAPRSVEWQESGTCEWCIDEEGCLVIRPADGAASGELENWDFDPPWWEERESIRSVKVEGTVVAATAGAMFDYCSNLESVDLSGLDTSKVTSMSCMFYDCLSLKSLDLSSLDTSNVKYMSGMFEYCSSLESLDLSGFDTSNVEYMLGMFHGCLSLKSLDLSSFDTSNVSDMQCMFYGCSSLEVLDLSSFDTSAVERAYREYQSQLYEEDGYKRGGGLEIEFDFGVYGMFDDCESLCALTLGGSFDFVDCECDAGDEWYYRFPPAGLRNPAAPQVWRAVGSGTVSNPKGATYYPAAALAAAHSAGDCTETYVVFQGGSWVSSSEGWWYRNADGTYPKSCWMEIDGSWYHFDSSGYMQTGWLKSDGSWYYLRSDGSMATGWCEVSGSWYHLASSGEMATGWCEVSGSWYYFGSSGYMQTGWQKVSGSWYHLASSGEMDTGWLKSGGSWYYLRSDGSMATGWCEVSGSWYYFGSSGVMQSSRWVGDYYLLSSGEMATSQWVDGGGYYVGADGKWVG